LINIFGLQNNNSNNVVRLWRELGDAENECTSHNFSFWHLYAKKYHSSMVETLPNFFFETPCILQLLAIRIGLSRFYSPGGRATLLE